MAYTLSMPEVGETVTEGTVEKWLKQPGDHIEKYEPIVEINTDKVNVELPSPVTGTMKEILAPEGAVVPVGGPLAVIDEVAGETPAEISPVAQEEQPKPAAAAPAKAPVAEEKQPAPAAAKAPVAAAPVKAPAAAEKDGTNGRTRATPRVRKLAEELGVDLARITGTGPGGRIVEEDVKGATAGAPAAVAKVPATAPTGKPAASAPAPAATAPATPAAAKPTSAAAATGDDEAVALTGIRRTIAKRMTESAFSAPHAWLAMEADVTGLVAVRQSHKEAFRQRHGYDLTYLPFMAHAVSQALLEHPYLNASWGEDKIILRQNVHLGIAVATERGLIVPVVKDADRLSVTGIAAAMHDLGERSRDNKLQLDDVQGGTFTLDNTGAFGSQLSMPIINLGQAAIISMEAITKKPIVVADNAIAVRSTVMICLSFDHRILDGHQAGAFLQDVKRRLEAYGPETGLD